MTRPAALFAALLAALLAAAARPPQETAPAPFVQAVEFPYYLSPPHLWEGELVALKNIGADTIEFSIPWNWHQVAPGDFDLTGRTNPRRDLAGLVHLARRVGLRIWVETGAPAEGWALAPAARPPNGWRPALAALLAAQTANHGGPIAWMEPPLPGIEAPTPPAPIRRIAVAAPDALARSRDAIVTGRGSLLWTGADDALYPAGWAPAGAPPVREGAIAFDGEERATAALRRDAMLLGAWAPLLPEMRSGPAPKPVNGKFPPGVTAALLVSNAASAVSVVNRGAQPFQDDLRAFDPLTRRSLVIPGVYVAPGESLWLPAGVSLSQKSLCRECSNFSPVEQILYATAELVSIQYENGILAMEFAAPRNASVALQLEREPVGPFLASGKPTEFEWDEKTLRARLPIPAGAAPSRHVRIGIAIEEPETSAFFDDAHRLIVGAKNTVSTTYSAPDVAARSRLRLPEGYSAEKTVKTPNQIDYQVAVPASAPEGDYANFALEVDGMALGRAHLELFHPLTIRFAGAMALHFGPREALTADPPVIPIEPKAGATVEVALRNNWPAIETYKLEATGAGLDFFPPKTEITIGAASERKINLRIFAAADAPEAASPLHDFQLRVTGGGAFDFAARALAVPRTGTVAWKADLAEDGAARWVLESAQARAVFSTGDGGRWMEFTWKDGSLNFLPEQGAFAGTGAVEVRAVGGALEFTGKGWTRTARLDGATLTVSQTPALPPDGVVETKRGNIALKITRETPARTRYVLSR